MDELTEKKRRSSLPRALARRIKAWADGMFSKSSEPAPAQPASAWLKSIESRTGPPADWLEFVQRNAQKGAAGARNSGGNPAVSPPPRPASPEEARLEGTPGVPAQPLMRTAGSRPPERSRVSRRATPPGVLSFEPISYARQPVQAPRPAPPLAESLVERSRPRFEPLAEPVAAPPRRPTPAEDPRPTVLHMPAASGSKTRESEAAAGTHEPPNRAEPLYPWKEESRAVPRRPSRELSLEDLDTLINRSWPPLANEAEPKNTSVSPVAPELLEEHRGGPWPELPELSPADSTEAQAVLRQWERLSRFDREQRGE